MRGQDTDVEGGTRWRDKTQGAGGDTGCEDRTRGAGGRHEVRGQDSPGAASPARLPEPGSGAGARAALVWGSALPKEPGAEQRGGAGGRKAFNVCSDESWASSGSLGTGCAGGWCHPRPASRVCIRLDASLTASLQHDLDALLCPTMSFNSGILSVLGKVNYVKGVHLCCHFFIASFILPFMF